MMSSEPKGTRPLQYDSNDDERLLAFGRRKERAQQRSSAAPAPEWGQGRGCIPLSSLAAHCYIVGGPAQRGEQDRGRRASGAGHCRAVGESTGVVRWTAGGGAAGGSALGSTCRWIRRTTQPAPTLLTERCLHAPKSPSVLRLTVSGAAGRAHRRAAHTQAEADARELPVFVAR